MSCNTITSKAIPAPDRMEHVDQLFGIHFPLVLEPAIYNFAGRLAKEYCGGHWQFYQLSNGGFYMAPDTEQSHRVISDNGFEGNMSADGLGMTACLYAYSHLSLSSKPNGQLYAKHFHQLRDFMLQHAEVNVILAAID